MSQNEADKVVKSQKNDPCGCTNTVYADDTSNFFPCLGHALLNAGVMLQAAGQRWAQIQEQAVAAGRQQRMKKGPHKR